MAPPRMSQIPSRNAGSLRQNWPYIFSVIADHLSTIAQTLILLSTHEFNMVRLNDRHCSGSSIMPQKRNPCSLEVIKAKASFAQGILMSLLSMGKALFMGYNRDTQWTKYWIMDLVEEIKPSLFMMEDVIRLLRVNSSQMSEQASVGFVGATPLMEWMARSFGLPLRKAKMVMEKAVKYSEGEGREEVSYEGLRKALREMKVSRPISEREVSEIQKPERLLDQISPIGTPSQKGMEENFSSLRKKMKRNRGWLVDQKRKMARAKGLISRMEKQIRT